MMMKSFSTSAFVKDEVGSSMMITLASKATAFAISTICFSEIESEPTCVSGF